MQKSKQSRGEWIVLVGGGSGGHVMPLRAICEEIFSKNSKAKVLVVTDRKYLEMTKRIFAHSSFPQENIVIKAIWAGKFRRYGRSLLRELLDIRTQALNLSSLILTAVGFVQSKVLKFRFRPRVVLCKGGFVAIPYCLAVKRSKIIVHDSDTRPGLANKVVSKYAVKVLKGLPVSSDGVGKSEVVGIPVSKGFRKYGLEEVAKLKDELEIEQGRRVLLVTGGSLGAEFLNQQIFDGLGELVKAGVYVLHQVGGSSSEQGRAEDLSSKFDGGYSYFGFSDKMDQLFAVADLIVCRAGATTIQELANAGKPAIVVPAGLTDQAKNGTLLKDLGATEVLTQKELKASDSKKLVEEILSLVSDENKLKKLSDKVQVLKKENSAEVIAKEILE